MLDKVIVSGFGGQGVLMIGQLICCAGMARCKRLTDLITERVSFIAPVLLFPGAYETQALVSGVLRIERGEEPVNEYPDNL